MKSQIVNLIRPTSVDQAIGAARQGYDLGADAVIADLRFWPEQARNVDTFRKLINAVKGEWIFCLYRNDMVYGADDERRMETLLKCAEAGATYVDVMGDLYDAQPTEMSFDEGAIARQRQAIAAAHDFGARVIMSSHVWNTFMDEEATLAVFKAQANRGADVVKLVSRCDTQDDLASAKTTMVRLGREMQVPWILLGSGKFGHEQRFLGLEYGCAMEFAMIEPPEDGVQPTISEFVSKRK